MRTRVVLPLTLPVTVGINQVPETPEKSSKQQGPHGLTVSGLAVARPAEVDVLVLLSTADGRYAVDDTLASLRWGFTRPFYLCVADESGAVGVRDGPDHEVFMATPPASRRADGWGVQQALARMAASGLQFKAVLILADTTLVLQPGLDIWLLAQLAAYPSHHLIGVQDVNNHDRDFDAAAWLLDRWGLPHQRRERAPLSLAGDVLVLSPIFVVDLLQRGLLNPADYDSWPASSGAYFSWLCQLLGHQGVTWGQTNKPLPPLYVHAWPGSRTQPGPHLLAAMFLVYGPATASAAYGIAELREMYKARRQELHRPFPMYGPTAFGVRHEP